MPFHIVPILLISNKVKQILMQNVDFAQFKQNGIISDCKPNFFHDMQNFKITMEFLPSESPQLHANVHCIAIWNGVFLSQLESVILFR